MLFSSTDYELGQLGHPTEVEKWYDMLNDNNTILYALGGMPKVCSEKDINIQEHFST